MAFGGIEKAKAHGGWASEKDAYDVKSGAKFEKKLGKTSLSPDASPEDKAWHEAEKGYTLGLGSSKKYPMRPEHINQEFINVNTPEDVDIETAATPERQKSMFYEPLYKKALEQNPDLDRETFYSWMQQLLKD